MKIYKITVQEIDTDKKFHWFEANLDWMLDGEYFKARVRDAKSDKEFTLGGAIKEGLKNED